VRVCARARENLVRSLLGLTVVPVYCSRMNVGEGNAPVTQQHWGFFHHYCGCNSTYLPQEVKCVSLMYYARSKCNCRVL